MRRLLALYILVVLLVAGWPPAVEASGGRPGAPVPALPDGYRWSNESRLTNDQAGDLQPQLALGTNGSAGVAWYRNGDLMWKRVDCSGTEITAERVVSPNGYPVQPDGSCAPCIGADQNGTFYLVSEPGGAGVYYSKLSPNGAFLVNHQNVPSGARDPADPVMVVTPKGVAHIIYSDGRFAIGFVDESYAQLDAGSDIQRDGVKVTEGTTPAYGAVLVLDGFGNLHAVVNHREDGFYHYKLDKNGSRIPGVARTYLYGHGGGAGSPSVACDAQGNVHLAWKSTSYWAGYLSYMKLDNDGKKLAAGVFGTGIALTPFESCLGAPSVQADSWGNAHLVWADDRDGGPQLYYLRIANGLENDTALLSSAARITSSTGWAQEPRLAIDSDDGLHLVWSDNSSGDFEIFHIFAACPRAELGIRPQDAYTLSQVLVNQTLGVNISVGVHGGWNGTVLTKCAVDYHGHEGWGVLWNDVTNATSLVLQPNETRSVRLRVYGPPDGWAGDYIDLKITANVSGSIGRPAELSFRTHLQVDRGLRLESYDKVHEVAAKDSTVYTIQVANPGSISEDVNLTAAGPPDWGYSLDRDRLHLAPHSGAEVHLNVTAPVDALGDDMAFFSVAGYLVGAPDVNDKATVTAVVSRTSGVEISADPAEVAVAPGCGARVNLTIVNAGNGRVATDWSLLARGLPGGWTASPETDSVRLAGGQARVVGFWINAPVLALAGTNATVTVAVRDENRTAQALCTVFATVSQVRSLNVSVLPEIPAMDPGWNAVFAANITNTGNGPDRVTPGEFDLPPGWKLLFMGPDGDYLEPGESVPLGAGETTIIGMVLSASADALAGSLNISGAFLDGAGNGYPATIPATVNQIHRVGLSAPEPVLNGTLAGSVSFPLTVENTGNGEDEIRFEASGLPAGWVPPLIFAEGNVTVDSIILKAGESASLRVLFLMPLRTELDRLEFTVTASAREQASACVTLVVNIKKPDLVISSVSLSSPTLLAGRRVYVCVTVENRGPVEAHDVIVACLRTGQASEDQLAGDIPAGGMRVLSFAWVPRAGNNTVRFVVDPDNLISEANETNNEALLQRDVAVKTNAAGANYIQLALIVVVPAAVIVMLLSLGRKKR